MALTLRTFGSFPPVGVWAASGANPYDTATAEELATILFYSDADGVLDGNPSRYVWS